ncbi:MAG TPA: hypothetical protein VGF56_01030 [Rhizomicrobium sp.]
MPDLPIGTPYGTQAPQRRRRGLTPLLWIVMLIVLAYWAMAAACIWIDPYNVYSWGLTPRLLQADYSPEVIPYMVDDVAKDPTLDTVLVGGSTSVDFTPEMMRLIPGVKNAFNLSYEGTMPYDRYVVTQEMLKYSHARRVLLAFDYNYALDAAQTRPEFPLYLYDSDWSDDSRMVGPTTFMAAASMALHRGTISNSGGALLNAKHALRFRDFQTPGEMRGLARLVDQYRATVDEPTANTCADFHAIDDQLVPYARELSKRGVALDIFIPPYAAIFPFEWQTGQRRGELGKAILNNQLAARRCLVEAVDGLPGVRVFAFDNEDWITGDLANYRDTAHTYSIKIQEFMMKAIANGDHRLTKANVDDYLSTLHRRSLAAKVYNSKVSFAP